MQLAQEYGAIGENAKLLDVCQEALTYFGRWNGHQINKERGAFYVGEIMARMNLFQFEEAMADYERAVSDKRNTDICRASLYLNGAHAYFKAEHYERCMGCCQQYLKLYNAYHDNEQKILEEAAFFVRDAFTKENLEHLYSYFIISGFRENQDEPLHTCFPLLSLRPDLDAMYFYPPLVPEILDYFGEAQYDQRFTSYADTLMNCKILTEGIVQELRKREKDSEKKEQFRRLVRIFAGVGAEHFYVSYLKILQAGEHGDAQLLTESFRYLFAHVVDIFQLPTYIWDIAMKYPQTIHGLFLEIPFRRWKSGIDAWIERSDAESVESRMKMLQNPAFVQNIRYDYFFVRAREALLVYGRYWQDREKLGELLTEFCISTIAFYRTFFSERAFSGEMEFLPESAQAALYVQSALENRDRGRLSEAKEDFRLAMEAFPSLESILKDYCTMLEEQARTDEMSLLAEGVKERIRFLLARGLLREAGQALAQLKNLVPEDEEIGELEVLACIS